MQSTQGAPKGEPREGHRAATRCCLHVVEGAVGADAALARKVEQAVQPKAADTAPPVPDPADPYPFLPGTLSRLMQEAEVTPDEVRYVIAQKGIYPAATPWPVICEDAQFMNGWLLHPDVWPQVVEAVKTNRTDEEVPF